MIAAEELIENIRKDYYNNNDNNNNNIYGIGFCLLSNTDDHPVAR